MTPELYKRLKPLFDAALDVPKEQRDQFVAEACKGDPQLEKGLRDLLAAHDEETGTLDKAIIDLHALKSPREQTFADGTVLLGRFRIVRLLGSGGMGEVYEAIDTQLGRIALKTVIGDITASPERLLRFRKEVQLARSVSNPHVVRIHELFLTEGSEGAFVTMEFLDGVTLADKVRESGPLPWREVRTVALELCDALHSIHEAEIIHRDLKTRNIMLATRSGNISTVLMDFGIARRLSHHSGDSSTGITGDGAILGTPDYMAPEQFEGKEPTPATDVYALGVVLYEIATGKRPVRDDTNKARYGKTKPVTRPSALQKGIPRRFDEVVCKCLEYDPKRRYQSTKEVERAIRLPSLLLHIQRKPLTAAAGMVGAVLLLSSLLLVPAIGERARGILFSSHEKHIAVLPLDITGAAPETQALGDGLMDALSGQLVKLGSSNQSLWVIPASEVRSRKVRSPTSALRELGATIVIQPRFERVNTTNHLKLTVIDAEKTREIGYVDLQSEAGDLALLQDEAVTRLGRLMNISVKEEPVLGGGQPATRAAYEDYLSGLGYIQRFDKSGNVDLAIASFEKALKIDPHFALGLAHLGLAYILKHDLDPKPRWLDFAQYYAEQASELDDKAPATYIVLANLLDRAGDHQKAIKKFQSAIDLDPRNAEAYSGMALAYQNASLDRDAEKAYIHAKELHPDYWNGYNNLGVFYDETGSQRKAIEQFNRALELCPENSAIYANLGAAYLNSKDFAKAERALQKSISLNPTYQAYANLGNLYGIQQRFAESASFSEKALAISAEDYTVWNNLAEAYQSLGQDERASEARRKAVPLVEKAINLNSKDADAYATLAALVAKSGNRPKALECIQKSLKLSNDWYVLSEVADSYEILGDRKRAIKCLEEALQNGLPSEQINGDPDLKRVSADPGFRAPKHGQLP